QQGDIVQGIESGADDYVTKPFQVHELRARLRAGLRILELQDELVRAREALRDQATRDGLTRLWNRTYILDILDTELARAARVPAPLSVILADLDEFKSINDTYGHLAGDAVLREAAARMSALVRRYDSLGRYGGEEFLVVLPSTDMIGAISQAKRLRETLIDRPFEISAGLIRVTGSFGVSCKLLPDPRDADHLIREADHALYAAKRAGRNRVEMFVREQLAAAELSEPEKTSSDQLLLIHPTGL